MDKPDLLEFLTKRMSMTDVYQPVLIKELLLHDGRRTKTELASALAAYDLSVQEYYERIVMRWPKITLSKHGIIDYERSGSIFRLLPYPESTEHRMDAVRICEEKISSWLERKKTKERAPEAGASVRYAILKAANCKCALCGISSEIKPIDKQEELADMIEVIFALGRQHGASKDELMQLVERKRDERGGFKKGYLYRGDEQEKKQTTKNAGRA